MTIQRWNTENGSYVDAGDVNADVNSTIANADATQQDIGTAPVPKKVDETTGILEGAGSGAVSGATLGTAIEPGWGTVIGGVVGAIAGGLISWYGEDQQAQAAKGANAQNLGQYEQEEVEQGKEKQLATKWKSDEENYAAVKNTSDRLLSMLNGSDELKQNLQKQMYAKPAAYSFKQLNPV